MIKILLDIKTLSFLSGMISVILALTMFFLQKSGKTYKGFLFWTLGFTFNALGMVLLGLRHSISPFFSIIIANMAITLYLILCDRGTSLYCKAKPHNYLHSIIVVLQLILFLYFTYYVPNIPVRIIIISFIFTLIGSYTLFTLIKFSKNVVPNQQWILLTSYSMIVIWFLLRTVLTALSNPSINDFMKSGNFQAMAFIILIIAPILSTLGFMIMNHQRLASDFNNSIEKLFESEEEKNRFFNLSQDFIGISDWEGHLRFANRSFLQTFKLTEEDLKSIVFMDLVYPEDRVMTTEVMKKMLLGQSVTGFENRYIKPDGTILWISWNATPDVEKRLIYFVARDISESKRVHEELISEKDRAEQALRTKSEFLSNMSHEIRTPLNAVTGFSELLEGMVEDSKQRSYLNSIKMAGRNLLSLINDILDLSKIEAGQMEIHSNFFKMSTLFNEMYQIFKLKAEEKNLTLETLCEETIGFVKLDEMRIRQILFNLIGNAIKFTDTGKVTLSTTFKKRENKGDLKIIISDTGIGIPKKDQRRIFEYFQQQEGHENKHFGGTGLGLAISKRLVEMQGGTISVESIIAKGSIFTISFPNVEWHAPVLGNKLSKKIKSTSSIHFQDSMVWIVDDVYSNRRLLEEQLKSVGLEFQSFDNGNSLLETLTFKQPDMIITDIRMPGLNGIEMAQTIIEERKLSIPLIALTASIEEYNYDIEKKLFSDYLAKPLEIEKLLDMLKKYIPFRETENNEINNSFKNTTPISNEIEDYLREIFLPILDQFNGAIKVGKIKKVGEELLKKITAPEDERVAIFAQTIIDAANSYDINTLKEIPGLLAKFIDIK